MTRLKQVPHQIPHPPSSQALVIGKDRVDGPSHDHAAATVLRNGNPRTSVGSLRSSRETLPPISHPNNTWRNRLSFEDYRDCCAEITRYIRGRGSESVTKEELRRWVSAQTDSLLIGRRDSAEREMMANVVVDRLVEVDLILIQSTEDNEQVLRVHPNFRES